MIGDARCAAWHPAGDLLSWQCSNWRPPHASNKAGSFSKFRLSADLCPDAKISGNLCRSAKSIQRSPGKLQPNHGKRSWGRSAKKTNVKPVAASPIQQLQQIFSRGCVHSSPFVSGKCCFQTTLQCTMMHVECAGHRTSLPAKKCSQ